MASLICEYIGPSSSGLSPVEASCEASPNVLSALRDVQHRLTNPVKRMPLRSRSAVRTRR
jgi:hypothetical protein